MTDRPILFSAPMVRAILAGRKTQTRRIVKPQPFANNTYHRGDVQASECAMRSTGDPACFNFGVTAVDGEGGLIETIECPYGCQGDRLWVRETWCKLWPEHQMNDPDAGRYYYAATDDTPTLVDGDGYTDYTKAGRERSPWKPSIHMPRKASRITLEITGVRVDRLQEIGHRDAAAEGWPADDEARALAEHAPGCADDAAIEWYADLWDSINGPGSWDANPWVWVVEFKRVTP